MDDQLMLIMTIAAVVVLVLMIVVIRIGLRGSQADSLMDVPPPEELLDKAAAGERIAILPERPDVKVENAPSVLNPERPKDDAAAGGIIGITNEPASVGQPSPWDQPAQIGDNETESGYSDDQLMEREIKALLLQDRADRAVAHVMSVKKVDEAEAERIVASHAEPGQV